MRFTFSSCQYVTQTNNTIELSDDFNTHEQSTVITKQLIPANKATYISQDLRAQHFLSSNTLITHYYLLHSSKGIQDKLYSLPAASMLPLLVNSNIHKCTPSSVCLSGNNCLQNL